MHCRLKRKAYYNHHMQVYTWNLRSTLNPSEVWTIFIQSIHLVSLELSFDSSLIKSLTAELWSTQEKSTASWPGVLWLARSIPHVPSWWSPSTDHASLITIHNNTSRWPGPKEKKPFS